MKKCLLLCLSSIFQYSYALFLSLSFQAILIDPVGRLQYGSGPVKGEAAFFVNPYQRYDVPILVSLKSFFRKFRDKLK